MTVKEDAPLKGPAQKRELEAQSISRQKPQLEVADALKYLDSASAELRERRDVYDQFLDVMKDFKNGKLDTPGVIERVVDLFHGHPTLIQGFNAFLPPGYRLESTKAVLNADVVTITTPSGTSMRVVDGRFQRGAVLAESQVVSQRQQRAPTPVDRVPLHSHDEEFVNAIHRLQKIRLRFLNDPEQYQRVISLLSPSSAPLSRVDIWRRLAEILTHDADLLEELSDYFPDLKKV